jgi:hypothetical protein
MREYHVRICEGLGVQFPGSTRLQQLPEDCHWSAPVGLSTAGQRFNRGNFRGQGPEVAAPENDELRNRLLCG